MAVTKNSYTAASGSEQGPYSYSFPVVDTGDIKVSVNGVVKTVTTHYTLDTGNTRITFVSGQYPTAGDNIIVYRDTDEDPITNTFVSGSTIRSTELNDNFKQILYLAQEADNQALSSLGGTMSGTLHLDKDQVITFEGSTGGDSKTTTLTVEDPTANRTLTLPNKTGAIVSTGDTGTVTSTMIADGTIVNADIANTTITGSKLVNGTVTTTQIAANTIGAGDIANNTITATQIAANTIGAGEIANNTITATQIANNAVTSNELADNAVDTAAVAANAITANELASNAVTTAKINADAVDGTKIADNSINSEHYVDGSIDRVHLAADIIDSTKLNDACINSEHFTSGCIDLAHMSANSVDSDQYVDGSIDSAHIANDQIDSQHYAAGSIDLEHMSANSVDSDQYVDGSIDRVHLSADIIDATKIADDAVTTDHIQDAELVTLAGMQSGTASKLADSTALTSDIADLNQIDGMTKETSVTDDDAKFPTSGAVVDYVAAQIAPIGGLEVIATDAAFPNTQPSAGVVISIADAGGLVVNGSGTSTTGRTANGTTVTINNINSQFNSTTIDAGVAMMVSSTGSGQIYNYHKATLKEADLLSLSGDINDFAERYRVAGTAPSSSLDEGDLWWDSAADKLKVYDGSAWEEVASSGDFYINTISSYSGTGGNSATFNGSAYRFVLSNPGSTAQQHVVSVNGVIQKPNSGTSQPSEGFVIDGSSIIFSNAPASGSDYFILTLGTTVSIGTPSDNTVATAKIQNLAVTTAKIAADAVDGTKIADNAIGNEHLGNDVVTGAEIADNAVGAEHIEDLDANVQWLDSKKAVFGFGSDLEIYHNGSHSFIENDTGALVLKGDDVNVQNSSGEKLAYFHGDIAELWYNNSKKFETTDVGVTATGHIFSTTKFRGNDDVKVSLGTSEDLQIFHDGTESWIKDVGPGDLNICAKDLQIKNADDDEFYMTAVEGGAVSLYHSNSKKFETNSSGCQVTGTLWADGIDTGDNEKLLLGDGDDFLIYHDGSKNIIQSANGHDTHIYANGTPEEGIKIIASGAVESYHDGNKKLETTATGIKVTGTINETGKVAEEWSLTSSFNTTGSTGQDTLTANWALTSIPANTAGSINAGMSQSSGVFTFPSTGVWNVTFNGAFYSNTITYVDSRFIFVRIEVTTDNGSTWVDGGYGYQSIYDGNDNVYAGATISKMLDVTNTSNVKVKFTVYTEQVCVLAGGSSGTTGNRTYVTFTRLGDT